MNNLLVAEIFRKITKILEIKGENVFRIRAYERAGRNIESLSQDVASLVKEDRLDEIPGVGKDLAEKVREIVKTGRLKFLEELEKSVPGGILELLEIPSVGPKTASLLYRELKIKNIADLEKAIAQNKIKGLFGIKEKTIENIKRGIEIIRKGRERMVLSVAQATAGEFIQQLKKIPEIAKISAAGSLRRKKDTVRDIDILAVSKNHEKVMNVFTGLAQVKAILAKGETKSSVLTKDDIQVDLRVVDEKSFGAALFYFTGSKSFNIKIRQLAIRKKYKLNEYGLFSEKRRERLIAGRTEDEIFAKLGMDYIAPELREDTGEIELALKHKLPTLIELKDIKGDLHAHSKWSDGSNSIEEIVEACIKRGYSYIAVTDHSKSLKVAGGLSVAELKKKKSEIDKINKKLKNFRVLYAAEVDIDSGGRLDYRDEVLKEFDVVVAAIHTGFKQSKEQLTRRIVKAAQNKYAHIIAHPTGRLWGTRTAYDLDFKEIFKAARDTNTQLEINSFPNRLDLNETNARSAKEAGVKIAISTDAHTTDQLFNMEFGVSVARRGWLSKKDVINTLTVDELLKAIKK